MFRSTTLAIALLTCSALSAACGPSVKDMPGPSATPNERRETIAPPAAPSDAPQPTTGSVDERGDAPEISRSSGQKGGVVVLWPRVVLPRGQSTDAATRALAGQVQARMSEVARRVVAGDIDVRPEPERVCPRPGCVAANVGVLVARAGNGCAAVAMVSRAGERPAKLVPWAGRIELDSDSVGFREPPERVVHVKDYVPCDTLVEALAAQEARVEDAVREASR